MSTSLTTPKPRAFVSYGIACVRKAAGRYEILMIKKRCSYSFIEFIRGSYDPCKKHDISYLLDGMTVDEKRVILSNQFDRLWFHAYGSSPILCRCEQDICDNCQNRSVGSKYLRPERKYKALMNIKHGQYIRELVHKSTNLDLLWEIPKGRMNKGEAPISSAIREFEEETSIDKHKYRLLFDDNTVEYTFIDNGVRYKYVYYLAIAMPKMSVEYDYNNEHMSAEISDMRFLPLDYIKALNNNRLHRIAKVIIKKCKKYII